MTRYYVRVDDLGVARGSDASLSWSGQSPQDLAQSIERSLRDGALIGRWRDAQEAPEDVDAGLLATDPDATVTIEDKAHSVALVITTRLPHRLVSQRLNLLIGPHWTLGDVK